MPPATAGQPAAMKKQRKKRRRGGIGGLPIRRPPKPIPADRRPLAERRAAYKAAGGVADKKSVLGPRRINTTADERLPQLWLNTYELPIMLELMENDFLGVSAGAQLLQHVAPHSTYDTSGVRISRFLPACVRRKQAQHPSSHSRTGGGVFGRCRCAPRPDPFGWALAQPPPLTTACAPQDRARLPQRHQTIPGGFDAFSS